MKVVLFCGGLGTRLREYSDTIPKPLVPIGDRPIIWHLMRYYAHFGHTEFILCLGYKGILIKEYFLDYKEWASNDFTLRPGTREPELFERDLDDWTMTFVDTGLDTNIGQRLMAVQDLLGEDEMFLANYADGLTNLDLDAHVEDFRESNAVASFLSVRPPHSFHTMQADADGYVTRIDDARSSGTWINGGFFVARRELFDYMRAGEELVEEPFARLLSERRLRTYRHEGFWACMDTFKDKRMFDRMHEAGEREWEVWKRASGGSRDRGNVRALGNG
jgi:glucose-1-phosphate cytidylyltransferase